MEKELNYKPTEKQLKYARDLGITDINKRTLRYEVSFMIQKKISENEKINGYKLKRKLNIKDYSHIVPVFKNEIPIHIIRKAKAMGIVIDETMTKEDVELEIESILERD
jgi:hypothetical protein